jgi:hypothetical protein
MYNADNKIEVYIPMKISEVMDCIVDRVRTLHYGMNREDAQILQCDIIFDPVIINNREINPKPGNNVMMWQREVQYQMGRDNKSLQEVRDALQKEARDRLKRFNPFAKS